MYFITYKPFGYEKEASNKGKYYNELGFNPVYCINAGTLLSAVIETVIAEPYIPEQAIFFKCNDYYLIDKLLHCRDLIYDENKSTVMNHKEIRERVIDHNEFNFINGIDMLGKAEYLVNPEDIEIIKIIDIRERMIKEIKPEDNIDIDELEYKVKENAEREWETSAELICNSHEVFLRRALAHAWWEWYTLNNDYFIEDYKHIIGTRKGDYDVSMERIDMREIDVMLQMLEDIPSEQTLNKIKDYLLENIIKGKNNE